MLIIKKKYKHHADFLEMGLIKQHSFLMYPIFIYWGSTNLVYLEFWSPVAIYYQRPSWSLIEDWENLWQLKLLAAQNGKRKNIWSIVLLSTKNSPDYQQSLSDFRTIVLDKCIKNIHWTRNKYKYSIQKTQCFIFQYLHSGLVQINTPCFGFFSVVWTGLMINISAWALIKYKPKINI